LKRLSSHIGLTAVATAAALAVGPVGATAKPQVSEPLAGNLVGPLHLEVSRHGILVSQSFAGTISKVKRDGTVRDLVVEQPALEGGTADIGGVASRGRTIAYLYASSAPPPDEESPGEQVASQLKIRKPGGKVRVLADLLRFEKKRNPDANRTYGFLNLDDDCADEVDAAGIPGVGGQPYTGIIESNPYEIARAPRGGWYVADAAANVVLYVSKHGKIRVKYVGKPQRTKVTEEAAGMLGLPECTVGATYAFEAVPTDVEVTRSGRLVVSHLPGGPEDPSLGARGSVVKVNPRTHRAWTIGRGILGATNVAVGPRGKVYVSELFGNRVAVLRHGRPRTIAELPLPAAVESFRGRLFATANVFPGPEGPDGQVVAIRLR
jgi:hypothetical protein